jgi:citrate synthase
MSATDTVHEGLEGVVVTKTMLSRVDGEAGRLVIAGYDVETLAKDRTFEGATARLFELAGLPHAGIEGRIAEGRARAFELLPRLEPALACTEPMVAVRAAVDLLEPSKWTDAAHIVGAVGFVAAAHGRRLQGKAPLGPSSESHAADLLRILTGDSDAARARGLDAYLVTVIDHGMNASTFAARVVASTASDVLSSVAAGLAALKGSLHGGAPGPVLDMLDAVGDPANAEKWLEGEIAAKRRIMGMGHRVYRVRDPRAAVLEAACGRLESEGIKSPRLPLARAVEKVARQVLAARYPNRSLDTNVEFYTAVLLDTLRVPRSHFTTLFACGRVSGWLAHIAEQTAKGRLIRPESLYVGPEC